MRVAIVAECFLPEINGVTNSVLRIVEHLARRHHEVLVIAPGEGPDSYAGMPVVRVPAVGLPFYSGLRVGLPTGEVGSILGAFVPDVVHLAAPVVMGAAAAKACRDLDVPSVAVYQTDLPGFLSRYRLGFAGAVLWRWLSWVHGKADLTLAPSTSAAWALRRHGIERVGRWGRGVDLQRFDPRWRSNDLRAALAPPGAVLIGYVGRLAAEKRVELLHHLRGMVGTETVIVGDGPAAGRLRRALPEAVFLGFKTGAELSAIDASLDVFVHTGAHETFCQAVQEALASGVPVVAPASGGPLDLVRHGENGFLYPPDNGPMMRQAVQELVGDARLRTAMSRRARESVAGRDWEAIGDQLLDFYWQVTGASRPSRLAA